MSRWFINFCLLGLLAFGGCKEEPAAQQAPSKPMRAAAVELSVLVVGDQPLAEGIGLLRGEWAERSGGSLAVEQTTLAEFLAAEQLTADLVVYPSRHLGTLVQREWLRPLRDSVVQSEEIALDDQFPLIRNQVIRFGEEIYGLSLGEPPILLASMPENYDAAAPPEWSEISIDAEKSKECLSFPLAVEFLARALAYSQEGGEPSLLFDPQTMTPQIDSPPFARALQEMIANHSAVADAGKIRCSLSWPHKVDTAEGSLRFDVLPTTGQVYDPLRETWVKRDDSKSLVILGLGGRLVSVSRATRNSASAYKLLRWLVSDQIGPQLSARSSATLWYRRSQAQQASRWLEATSAGEEIVSVVEKSLSSNHALMIPRIPGIDEYLSETDRLLYDSLSGGQEAEAVLRALAEHWEQVTERHGRDRQRAAYRQHLGLADFNE